MKNLKVVSITVVGLISVAGLSCKSEPRSTELQQQEQPATPVQQLLPNPMPNSGPAQSSQSRTMLKGKSSFAAGIRPERLNPRKALREFKYELCGTLFREADLAMGFETDPHAITISTELGEYYLVAANDGVAEKLAGLRAEKNKKVRGCVAGHKTEKGLDGQSLVANRLVIKGDQ